MPASEYLGWQSYFAIYPFAQDQKDLQTAIISVTFANYLGQLLAQNAGKRTFQPMNIETFLPDYLGEREKKPRATEKSLEQQAAEFKAFKEKYKAAELEAKGLA